MRRSLARTIGPWAWMALAAGPVDAAELLSVDVDTDELIAIDVDTGDVRVIGATGRDFSNVELATFGGTLYAQDSDFPDGVELVIIDPTTGLAHSAVPVEVGGAAVSAEALTQLDGELLCGYSDELTAFSNRLGSLALDGTLTELVDVELLDANADLDGFAVDGSGVLYSIDGRTSDTRSTLYVVDPDVPSYTFIGSMTARINDIEFLDGRLFGIDQINFFIHELDPVTADLVASVPLDPPVTALGLSSLPVAPTPPELYSVNSTHDELIAIDPATGNVRVVGSTIADLDNVDLTAFRGLLYGADSQFPTGTNLVSIDPATGAVLSSVPLREAGDDLSLEGLAVSDGQLLCSYDRPPLDATAEVLGTCSLDGTVTAIFDYSAADPDLDGLESRPDVGLLSIDGNPSSGTSRLYEVGIAPPSYTLVGTASSPTQDVVMNDVVLLGDRLFGVDGVSSSLHELDPTTGARIDTLPLQPPFDVRGLAVLRTIALDPPSPGQAGAANTFTVTGATPATTVTFIGSLTAGSVAVPGCPGVTADMAGPTVLGTAVVDGAGEASVVFFVPGGVSGSSARFQAVESSTCTVSDLVLYTFP